MALTLRQLGPNGDFIDPSDLNLNTSVAATTNGVNPLYSYYGGDTNNLNQFGAPSAVGFESPANFIPSPSVDPVASAQQYASDTALFGQLASGFGSLTRYFQNNIPVTGQAISSTFLANGFTGSNGQGTTFNLNAHVDNTLAEKQASFGSPEFFSNLGRQALIMQNPEAASYGSSVAQSYLVNRGYVSPPQVGVTSSPHYYSSNSIIPNNDSGSYGLSGVSHTAARDQTLGESYAQMFNPQFSSYDTFIGNGSGSFTSGTYHIDIFKTSQYNTGASVRY